MNQAEEIIKLLEEQRNEEQRKVLMRFFKTGKGQYGEGDEFLGLTVPQTRLIVKATKHSLSLDEIEKLLYSRWHEARLCGLLLLVEEMKKAKKNPVRREEIAEFYLRHARQANNWDLVDLSCQYILGPYLLPTENYDILYRLADSDNLWEQRIAIISTLYLIRAGIFTPTLTIAEKLLSHKHDLIHKATGWALREVGKRDADTLRNFLANHYSHLPHTTLRYAIERLEAAERQYWLKL